MQLRQTYIWGRGISDDPSLQGVGESHADSHGPSNFKTAINTQVLPRQESSGIATCDRYLGFEAR